MKAVIYARYSCGNQREESIEGQLRECEAYCQKNDFTVVGPISTVRNPPALTSVRSSNT